jgi:hypothetical protein
MDNKTEKVTYEDISYGIEKCGNITRFTVAKVENVPWEQLKSHGGIVNGDYAEDTWHLSERTCITINLDKNLVSIKLAKGEWRSRYDNLSTANHREQFLKRKLAFSIKLAKGEWSLKYCTPSINDQNRKNFIEFIRVSSGYHYIFEYSTRDAVQEAWKMLEEQAIAKKLLPENDRRMEIFSQTSGLFVLQHLNLVTKTEFILGGQKLILPSGKWTVRQQKRSDATTYNINRITFSKADSTKFIQFDCASWQEVDKEWDLLAQQVSEKKVYDF